MAVRITIQERGLGAIQKGLSMLASKTDRAVSNAVGKLSHELRREIVTGIRSQAPGGMTFKPLADSTIQRKKSTKALINHGDLIRSINVTKLDKFVFFVGVHRMYAVRVGAVTMVNIAEIHEFGSKKRPGRPPARPFLIPSYKAWRYDAEKRFAELVGKELGVPAFAGIGAKIGSRMGGVSFGSGPAAGGE